MNEAYQANRIRQVLNHGLQDISPASARRLEAARHLALSRQKQPEPAWLPAAAGAGPMKRFNRPSLPVISQILAVAALLFGMWFSFYWHSLEYTSELEAVDSALLSDDLPPEALIDQEFLEWLKDDSSED